MMTSEMLLKLRKSLIKHEGYRRNIYTDSTGNETEGIGYNITERGNIAPDGMSKELAISECDKINSENYAQMCKDYDWFSKMNEDRQVVLLDMAYELGIKGIENFTRMIKELSNSCYILASQEMMDSEWAKQVPARAKELSEAMFTGVYNP